MELKPCPFCGGEANTTHKGNEHTRKREIVISCETFGCTVKYTMGAIRFGFDWLEERIVKAWNTRHDEEPGHIKDLPF